MYLSSSSSFSSSSSMTSPSPFSFPSSSTSSSPHQSISTSPAVPSPAATQSDSANISALPMTLPPSSSYHFHDQFVSDPKKTTRLVPCSNSKKPKDENDDDVCQWECQCHLTPCICECRCDRYDNWVTSTSISPHREMEWRTLIDPKLDSFLLSLLIQWGKVQRRPCDSKDLLCVDGWVIGSSEIIKRTNPRLFTPEGIKIPCPHCWSGKISYLFILCREPSWKPYWHIHHKIAADSYAFYSTDDYSITSKQMKKQQEEDERLRPLREILKNYCLCKPSWGDDCHCHPNEALLSEKDKEWERKRRQMNRKYRKDNANDNEEGGDGDGDTADIDFYFIVDMTCEPLEEKNKKYVGTCWSPLWYRAYDIFDDDDHGGDIEDDSRADVLYNMHQELELHCLSLVLSTLQVKKKNCGKGCDGVMCRGCGGMSRRHPLMKGCCSTQVFCDECYSGQVVYIVFLLTSYMKFPHPLHFAEEMVKIKRERMLQMGINWDEKHKEKEKKENEKVMDMDIDTEGKKEDEEAEGMAIKTKSDSETKKAKEKESKKRKSKETKGHGKGKSKVNGEGEGEGEGEGKGNEEIKRKRKKKNANDK